VALVLIGGRVSCQSCSAMRIGHAHWSAQIAMCSSLEGCQLCWHAA
jgi:hypothetical protein